MALNGALKFAVGFEEELLKAGLPGTIPMNLAWATMKESDLKKAEEHPLKLSLETGKLLISRGGQMLEEMPEDRLLARWWVNGKAVAAPAFERPDARAFSGHVKVIPELTVAFGYPSSLGKVKVGDKVALQVMYCPQGFLLSPELMLMHAIAERMNSANFPMVSNKIEFVITPEMIDAHEATLRI